ncbi:MAG: tetratricopeptide repeat protein, partial [Cyanobacteria bacterium P01_D01_bin.123]
AQEQRDYEQARAHYQQALDIKIEFNDRYSQASTYGQLGLLAKVQEDYEQAQQHLLQALEIFVEFGDEQSMTIVFSNLARIYHITKSQQLVKKIGETLNISVEQIIEYFDQLSSNNSDS